MEERYTHHWITCSRVIGAEFPLSFPPFTPDQYFIDLPEGNKDKRGCRRPDSRRVITGEIMLIVAELKGKFLSAFQITALFSCHSRRHRVQRRRLNIIPQLTQSLTDSCHVLGLVLWLYFVADVLGKAASRNMSANISSATV